MARALGGLVGTSAALAVVLRYLLFVHVPPNNVPGDPDEDPTPQCPECAVPALPVKRTGLFVCPDCQAEFGVAECAVCRRFACTDEWYRWICGPGHTTHSTRKCPCGRLGDQGEDGLWRCPNDGCAPFMIDDCTCGFGFATSYDGVRWHCELGLG